MNYKGESRKFTKKGVEDSVKGRRNVYNLKMRRSAMLFFVKADLIFIVSFML